MGFLTVLFWFAVALAVAIAAAWGFRALATAVTRGEMQRALRSAPLTASFGMMDKGARC